MTCCNSAKVSGLVQVSFQGTSGMYPAALAPVVELFAEFQSGAEAQAAVLSAGHQLKSVPPTAVSYGVDARPLTETPYCASYGVLVSSPWSQVADPASPVATKTAMPSLAAVCHR